MVFRMRTFGKVRTDKKLDPDRTYFVNTKLKTYDLRGFDNFVDAQNILIARNLFEKQGAHSRILALKGQSVKDMMQTGFKLKKGSITKDIEEGKL